jgi:general secretion pathway protein B
VSSILRALKKLENEPRHLEKTQPLGSKFVSLADTEPQRPVSSIFLMVVGTGIVCGLVILAGWWLFSEKDQPPPSVIQDISQQSFKPDKISPTPQQDLNKAPNSAVSEKPEDISMEEPETTKAVEQFMEAQPSSLEESALEVATQKNIPPVVIQTPQETIPAQETLNEQVTQTAEKTVVPSSSTPATPTKTVEFEIPKLNNPDMKLQAVTWSRVPRKRIAVINNRILREGEMVSSYLIKTINQDDVVLSQEGTKWKLMFR